MKKFISISFFSCLSQFTFANDKNEIQKEVKAEGCYYADIIYKPGEKHKIQEHVMDPVTRETVVRDAQPEVWQECIDAKNGKSNSPRFYWKTLPGK